MKLIASTGQSDIATLYLLQLDNGAIVECVESVQPPHPRDKKWVLIVSTMFGCPVKCRMCDAGSFYGGKLSCDDILEQIAFLVARHYPSGVVPCKQFKIQFARMGEPSLNAAVLDVLETLPLHYRGAALIPSLSTIAPHGSQAFLDRLLELKNIFYSNGRFQFQYSLHSTDTAKRDDLIPVKKLTFEQMGDFSRRFYKPGDRRITLNFALSTDSVIDPEVLRRFFDPDYHLIKITPLNPTYRAKESGQKSLFYNESNTDLHRIVSGLHEAGYPVIVSIGEMEENRIGSNCGQCLRTHLESQNAMEEGYTYTLDCAVNRKETSASGEASDHSMQSV